jgi:NAD(P)H-dependent flavin oxidoreductase YrpB (nitropropane dioxygenase family)
VEPDPRRVLAADPCGRLNARLVAAAGRAGGIGIIDLAASDSPGELAADLDRRDVARWWLRPGAGVAPDAMRASALAPSMVVLSPAGHDVASFSHVVDAWAAVGGDVTAQVVSRAEGEVAKAAGVAGLIASGSEAGGRVGDTEAFILFQHLVELGLPVWVRGGIGLHTAAAVVAGGGAGVVLDAQLGLLREAGIGVDLRRALAAMDGSETRVVGNHRFFTRPDLPAAAVPEDTGEGEIASFLGADPRTALVPIGQDGGFASGLADRFVTVGGVVQAVQGAIDDHLAAAAAAPPLAEGRGVAGPHGTRYPIAQGPMTRVSDRAEFAAAVADGGGLPFLALALLRGPEVRELLVETKELLGDRPWGVGVLGFVPAELRAEQLEVVHEVAPPHALIAGGRPSQATPLEAAGIDTYLHVPSPGLLDRFLKDGARKFVFEGRECGGHVGPRSSFTLWDAQIDRLLQVDDPEHLQVLFAGGIHDARSAAMAGAAAATLAARGAHVGVLMGTAYLFTEESVAAGAIQPAFQDVAVTCDTTVLLETAPGHATRCVETDFVRAFAARRDELVAEGVDPKARWAELESLNLGRLRIASKGLVRDEHGRRDVAEDEQRREGMYMIGEVATLRHEVTTIAALHDEVSRGSSEWLRPAEDLRLSVREREREPDPLDIAIVGMDGFFPGAIGLDQYWASIVAGTDAVTEVSDERWDVAKYYDADAFTKDAGRKTPSRWGGFLSSVGFDPLAYGIPPASLAAIEPVQLPASARSPRAPSPTRATQIAPSIAAGHRSCSAPRAATSSPAPTASGPSSRSSSARFRRASRTGCRRSPRTRSPACWPTSSPGASPTASTSAASTTPSMPPVRRRSPRSTRPARSCGPGPATSCSAVARTSTTGSTTTCCSRRCTPCRPRAGAARSTPTPTASPSGRASPASCSSAGSMPSATVTASTPSSTPWPAAPTGATSA